MEYTLNNYRARRFDDKFFVTTDHGSWCILTQEEFRKLKSLNIDKPLFDKLEEREIILTQQNVSEVIRLFRNRYQGITRGTSLHIVVPTLRCDMKCIYCHASSRPEDAKAYDMDEETAKKTVDLIYQTPSKGITIEFQGGEPLLNWDIVRYIIRYAQENKTAKKKLYLTIVTNLNLMDDEKMQFLFDNHVSVCTSLDGPKDLHDKNRPFAKKSNYDNVAYWITRFIDESKKRNVECQINALMTITRESLKYPKEIIDTYRDLGLRSVHLRSLNQLGLAIKTRRKIGYSAEEFIAFWIEALKHLDSANKKSDIKVEERTLKIFRQKILTEFDPNFLDLRSPCGAGVGQLVYMNNGDIYTCDEARMLDEDLFKLGNVYETTYKEATTCDSTCAVYSASINDQHICDECAYKPYCGICPVCNYAEQGSPVGNIAKTHRCKIYKAQFDWFVKNRMIRKDIKKDL